MLVRDGHRLVILVLLRLHVVLQEDLDFRVHLWANVLQEQAGNHGEATETNGRKRDGSVDMSVMMRQPHREYMTYFTP